MHPAASIILFTVASGTGYGLLAVYGMLAAFGLVSTEPLVGVSAVLIGLALVTLGLLASTAHLGQKQRAWRAYSQWRSSWLSREGVAATATYVPATLLGAVVLLQGGRTAIIVLGLIVALTATVTVYCTGMIYRSLKPIREWHNRLTVPVYLALAAAGGATWLCALAAVTGTPHHAGALSALAALLVSAALKRQYWRHVDDRSDRRTIADATGLGGGRRVRLLDPPHTTDNYLMKEMGYRIARKHAVRLRGVAALCGLSPFLLLLLSLVLGAAAPVLAVAAALLVSFGLIIERWLFFAEARHTVQLYYGAEEQVS